MSLNFTDYEDELAELALVTVEQFSPLVNQSFTLLTDTGQYQIQLQQVESSPRHEISERQPFSMLFQMADYLPQGTYRLRHQTLGTLPLFFVPIGQQADGYQYQVIIT